MIISCYSITFVDEPFDVHEHVWKRSDLLAVFEQLCQIIGDALRVDRVHFRHFHGNFCRVTKMRKGGWIPATVVSINCDGSASPDDWLGVSFDEDNIKRDSETFFAIYLYGGGGGDNDDDDDDDDWTTSVTHNALLTRWLVLRLCAFRFRRYTVLSINTRRTSRFIV